MPQKNKEKSQGCICVRCPSCGERMKEKMLNFFCMRRKFPCPIHRRGCVCRICPIAKKGGLTGRYYCETGKR